MLSTSPGSSAPCSPTVWRRTVVLSSLVACAALAIALAQPMPARAAALGESLFYPCTSCHPIDSRTVGTKELPNGFSGHEIELQGHDVLGRGPAACLVCHGAPGKDPAKLKLVDGSEVEITGDVSGVCYRCHSAKYEEWQTGAHGKSRPKCTSSGCHDPHAPGSIYAQALPPFVGTGFQVKVLPEREPFTPLAAPAAAAPVETPEWLEISAVIGALAACGVVGSLVFERSR